MEETTIPKRHRDLLDETVRGLMPDDERFVRNTYGKMRDQLRSSDTKLYDELFRNLEQLDVFLDKPDGATEQQKKVALAALKYFVQTHDNVNDDHVSGLIDDAIVVRAAMLDLRDAL